MTLYQVFRAGSAFLQVIDTAILVYVIMSWFRPRNTLYMWLEGFVRPFVAPFRRLSIWLMRRTGVPLDFSCWFAMIGISIIERLWMRLYYILRMI